jgi:ATP-dependent exoDNAse (exonuclease V) alpha subunit
LEEKGMLTATTGIAGFHIGGITLHSAVSLPVQAHNRADLSGNSLARLQQQLKDVKYIIIDEVSMLGQKGMEWLDRRLKQASGNMDTPFGGYSIILIGDFAQLPPVGDRALYIPPPNGIGSHGHTVYRLFTTVIILKAMVRQAGTTPEHTRFRELLLRLRDGCTTKEDWALLLTRAPSNVSNATDFEDAVHLFYKKEDVNRFNIEKLTQLPAPTARIAAIHSSSEAAKAKQDDAGGLEAVVHLAKGAKVMLTSNLWQQTGLCNGAIGVIDEILYAEGQKPPNLPIAVTVNFPEYTGPPFMASKPKCIPIAPLTFQWHNGSTQLSRQQLPLRLSYAITIHKSQGQTLTKAVIDIGDREMAAGCTFVAISRMKRLSDCIIQPMPYKRLQSIGN